MKDLEPVILTEKQEQQLEFIAKHKHKNERLSWKRKNDKMQDIIKELEPIEAEMLKWVEKKQEIYQRIQELRQQMVKECIHPRDCLVYMGDYIACKFCNVNISLPRDVDGS